MQVPDNLLCLFSGKISEQDDSYVIEIPKEEIANGNLQSGAVYRTAVLPSQANAENTEQSASTNTEINDGQQAIPEQDTLEPPVQKGEIRDVEIEDTGDQGDGIARVERGYVIIVPDAEVGDRETIEITNARENVGFAEIVEQ